jgi:uncharacterized protein (DUF1778 family)
MKAKTGTFPLRLPLSLKAAIEEAAARDGVSMNQFIVMAATEKLSAMHTAERFFAERRGQGDADAAIRFLQRQDGELPRAGDELPAP